jgi:hypothetical protein
LMSPSAAQSLAKLLIIDGKDSGLERNGRVLHGRQAGKTVSCLPLHVPPMRL